jgi:hypothetical protein
MFSVFTLNVRFHKKDFDFVGARARPRLAAAQLPDIGEV